MLNKLLSAWISVYLKETANRPLRGVSPSASNKKEARELLAETYEHIEQSVDDIDAAIANLQEHMEIMRRFWRTLLVSVGLVLTQCDASNSGASGLSD